MVTFPMAIISFLILPSREFLKNYQMQGLKEEAMTGSAWATEIIKSLEISEMSSKFDYVGTFFIVAAAVLAIFGLTDGGESDGW